MLLQRDVPGMHVSQRLAGASQSLGQVVDCSIWPSLLQCWRTLSTHLLEFGGVHTSHCLFAASHRFAAPHFRVVSAR